MTYQLRGREDKWWKTWKRGRACDAPPVEWKEFQKAFRNQFIQKSVRDALMQEFETLRQGSQTMEEYDTLFVEGLRDSLFSRMGAHMETFPSYVIAMDTAHRMERRMKIWEEQNNKRKRGHGERSFGRGGNSTPAASNKHAPSNIIAPRPQSDGKGGTHKPQCSMCGRRHYEECYDRTCYQCG